MTRFQISDFRLQIGGADAMSPCGSLQSEIFPLKSEIP
jgi:hypothetical protein